MCFASAANLLWKSSKQMTTVFHVSLGTSSWQRMQDRGKENVPSYSWLGNGNRCCRGPCLCVPVSRWSIPKAYSPQQWFSWTERSLDDGLYKRLPMSTQPKRQDFSECINVGTSPIHLYDPVKNSRYVFCARTGHATGFEAHSLTQTLFTLGKNVFHGKNGLCRGETKRTSYVYSHCSF